jgi:transposase-like protein
VAEHGYKAVLAVIADGRTVTEVARDWGVRPQTAPLSRARRRDKISAPRFRIRLSR